LGWFLGSIVIILGLLFFFSSFLAGFFLPGKERAKLPSVFLIAL
jgi:hypothetical protein